MTSLVLLPIHLVNLTLVPLFLVGVVRKLKEMLPKVRDNALHRDLSEMLQSHELNIERASEALRTNSGG